MNSVLSRYCYKCKAKYSDIKSIKIMINLFYLAYLLCEKECKF